MAAQWNCVWVLLFLLLHISSVVAGPLYALRRDDATIVAVTMAPMTTAIGDQQKGDAFSSEITEATNIIHKQTSTMTATITTVTTSFPSAINGNTPNNMSSLSSPDPIPAGELPLQPRLTPGWGVAGALLLITGTAYTLIGIKNPWLYTFFSSAFLSALSVAVLIVYVMTPPVPAAIEGAYVVAVVVAGLIFGGAATVFREIAEGLGCLLGGFCVSMWLLTLRPGGLLPSPAPKVIFIAVFSAGSYGFYFSHYTRPYALMGLMSFSGATITVLGIDCFSRAGLKEFWVYIWDLNKSLFPYMTNTYPLTKGITVEIALTAIFTIIGIISQLRLWKVVQDRRAQKNEEQTKEKQKRDEEEARLGLQIEAQNARERRQWETTYGNHQPQSSSVSGISGTEDLDDEKPASSQIGFPNSASYENHDERIIPHSSNLEILSRPTEKPADVIVTRDQIDERRVAARSAADTEPRDTGLTSNQNENSDSYNNGNPELGPLRSSQLLSIPRKTSEPEIIPLPFKIPDAMDGNDDRSSVVAYADEDDANYILSDTASILSLIQPLPTSVGGLHQSPSERSVYSQTSKPITGELGVHQVPRWTRNTEDLIENAKRHSEVLSITTTIDDSSDSSNDEPNKALLDSSPTSKAHAALDSAENAILRPTCSIPRPNHAPYSLTDEVALEDLETSIANLSSGDIPKSNTLSQSAENIGSVHDKTHATTEDTAEVPSASVSLTKDRLPSALPRVALSYRTNEWAKHLNTAEVPPIEDLRMHEYANYHESGAPDNETVAPIDLEDLQQTSYSAIPPTRHIRSPSSISNSPLVVSPTFHSTNQATPCSPPSQGHIPTTLAILQRVSLDAEAPESPIKPMLSKLHQAVRSPSNKEHRRSGERRNQPIQGESGSRNLVGESSPGGSAPIPGVVSYSSPQTLLSKREMLLRNGSRARLLSTPPIQESSEYVTRPISQVSPLHNHGTAQSPSLMSQDADDMPLSQRKQLMRRSSALSSISVGNPGGRSQQGITFGATRSPTPNTAARIHTITADSSSFDSHQPRRSSSRFSQAERDARLSLFRQSVAEDLRVTTLVTQNPTPQSLLRHSASSMSLSGLSNNHVDVGRAMDQQHSLLMSQRGQEAQKQEMELHEKERHYHFFQEMMRRGELVDAHREALRRMQGDVKQK